MTTNTDAVYTPREACDKGIMVLGGILRNEKSKLPQGVSDQLENLRQILITSFEQGGPLATATGSGGGDSHADRKHSAAGSNG